MGESVEKITELREMRNGVLQALVDIWRGARLEREGVDITDTHKAHLRGVLADIDAKIVFYEGSDVTPCVQNTSSASR